MNGKAKTTRWLRPGFLAAIVVAVALAFSMAGVSLVRGGSPPPQSEVYEDLKVFTEILELLQKSYVEPVNDKELIRGAIKGMVNTLDPHSAYMSVEIYKEIQVDTKGEFFGLGLQVGSKENRLVVISPIEGTPADLAGVKAGDQIIKVDDISTRELSLMEAVNRMRGPKGSKVTLTILRESQPDPMTFVVVRDLIKIQSVRSKVLEPGIGYLRLTQFQEQSARDVARALDKLKEEKIHSLILDLRNNPGGLLTSAVEVSGQFLEPGKEVVSIKGREGRKEEHFSPGGATAGDFPMIVLVNEGSASASEIVAGALQDWGRAVVVGTTTFGKGSVQTILPLKDGSALRLTTAKYYTPKGRSIQNTGIEPDIVVRPRSPEGTGAAQIREKDLERHLQNDADAQEPAPSQPEASKPDSGRKGEAARSQGAGRDSEDLQLNKAVELLKSWRIFKERGSPQEQAANRTGAPSPIP